MLKVYEAEQVIDAELVCRMLERRGIAAFVFGEHTFNAPGVNPFAWPEVWVAEDGDYAAARVLVHDYECSRRSEEPGAYRWYCRSCGEMNEGSFAVCWCCGQGADAER